MILRWSSDAPLVAVETVVVMASCDDCGNGRFLPDSTFRFFANRVDMIYDYKQGIVELYGVGTRELQI